MNNNHEDQELSPLNSEILDQLVAQITSVAALDFTKKITNIKGDGSALDTIALGLNMLCEELEDSVVSRDKLEEKNAELEQVISKMNQFQYALNSSSIVVTTDLKGNITYLNDKFCEISKYSRDELLGQTYNVVDSGHHSIDSWKEMWQTIGRGEIWSNEVKERAKDGSYYWVNMTIVPFFRSGSKTLSIYGGQ
jgi:PAS domain S-box-containing protein